MPTNSLLCESTNCLSLLILPLSNCTRLPRLIPLAISLKSPGLIGRKGSNTRPALKSTATSPPVGSSSVFFLFRQFGWLLHVDHSYCRANSCPPISCKSFTKSAINCFLARYSGEPSFSASIFLPACHCFRKSRWSSTSSFHVRPSTHSLNSPQLPNLLSTKVAWISTTELSLPNRICAPRLINFCQSAPDLAAVGLTWSWNGPWKPTQYRKLRKSMEKPDGGISIFIA